MANTLPKIIGGCSGCFLVAIIGGIVLISLFYLEENWRGAHELAEAKARWAAVGLPLEAESCVPPPVPDDRNLAALPIYQLEPDPEIKGQRTDLRLKAAVDPDKHGGALTDTTKKTDLATMVAKAYAKKFPGKLPPTSAVAQLEELYPIIVDLRAAAPTHPEFRLNIDYMTSSPLARPFGPVTRQIAVAKLFEAHAQLALNEGHGDVALQDIQIDFQIARGVVKDPSLIGGLVAIGVTSIARMAIDEGLSKHEWSDAQLAQLQEMLKRPDFLSEFPLVMRGETAVSSLRTYDWIKGQSNSMHLIFGMSAGSENDISTSIWQSGLGLLWATGWWDMNAVQSADMMLGAVRCVDPKARRVDPALKQQLDDKMGKAAQSPTRIAPWNILFFIMQGPMTDAVVKFAQGQVQSDEDRIVCALERYHLANGTYPPKLDTLAPEYIDALPHDIMNGEPYRYRSNADGTFVIYSVGWDQVDEGGTMAFRANNPKQINFETGDWVWPMVPR